MKQTLVIVALILASAISARAEDFYMRAVEATQGAVILNGAGDKPSFVADSTDEQLELPASWTLSIGTLRLDDSAGDGGASLIGANPTALTYSSATDVQAILEDIDAAMSGGFSETEYFPASQTLNEGTTDSGSYEDLDDIGTNDFVINEEAGASSIDLEFGFTGVGSEINQLIVRGYYDGGSDHNVAIQIYNYTTTAFETQGLMSVATAYQWFAFPIFLSSDYLDTGAATVRFLHLENGNASHDLILDYVALRKSTVGGGGVTDHGSLAGLGHDDHTQYLLADGTRGLSANWDAGSWEVRAETLESDVGTGTAPFTVASSTLVTNLNADLLDGESAAAFQDQDALLDLIAGLSDPGADRILAWDEDPTDGMVWLDYSSFGDTQNLWETFTADSGSATANATDDSFAITGGTDITTAISGDEVTITADAALARDSEVTSAISAHAGVSDAHHSRYTDAEAVSAVEAESPLNLADEVIVTGSTSDIRFLADDFGWEYMQIGASSGDTGANLAISRRGTADGSIDNVRIFAVNMRLDADTALDINSPSTDFSGDVTVNGTLTASLSIGLDGLSDTTITGPLQNRDALIYNGSAWVDRPLVEADISDLQSYLTSESDPLYVASTAFGIDAGDVLNWDTAYGWGDHASAGYLSEADAATTYLALDASNDPLTGDLTIGTDGVATRQIRLNGGTESDYGLMRNDDSTFLLQGVDNHASVQSTTGYVYLRSAGGQHQYFNAGNYWLFRDEDSLNANRVSINSANADTNIIVVGTGVGVDVQNATGPLGFLGSDSSAANRGVLSLFEATTPDEKVRLSAVASDDNWIDNGGDFGIGTDSPSTDLHVSSSGTTKARVTGTFPQVQIDDTGGQLWSIVSDVNKLFIAQGEGTSDPVLTIEADEDALFGNDIEVQGNTIRDSGSGDAIQFDGSQNTTILGDLTVDGALTLGSRAIVSVEAIELDAGDTNQLDVVIGSDTVLADVVNATGSNGVTLPSAVAGRMIMIKNAYPASLKIWPNTGDVIDQKTPAGTPITIGNYDGITLVAFNAMYWDVVGYCDNSADF